MLGSKAALGILSFSQQVFLPNGNTILPKWPDLNN